jgi:flagellar L-ring protein FlgH
MKIDRLILLCMSVAACLAAGIPSARGQTSSLFNAGQQRQQQQPLTLNDCSWTLQPAEEPRTIKLHDLVTVRVDEKSAVISDGQMDRKKIAHGDLVLKNWIKLYHGFNIGSDKFNNGVPHIRGELDNKMQSQGNLETRDSLKFVIACNVVDIRPNGNLVLEGRRTIKNNEDTWEYSLSGEIRPDSIKMNSEVLSSDVADMRIVKRESGHVRDSYRRGWALEWLDKWQPF